METYLPIYHFPDIILICILIVSLKYNNRKIYISGHFYIAAVVFIDDINYDFYVLINWNDTP